MAPITQVNKLLIFIYGRMIQFVVLWVLWWGYWLNDSELMKIYGCGLPLLIFAVIKKFSDKKADQKFNVPIERPALIILIFVFIVQVTVRLLFNITITYTIISVSELFCWIIIANVLKLANYINSIIG